MSDDALRDIVERGDPEELLRVLQHEATRANNAEAALVEAKRLLADAYEEWGDEGHPTNWWRKQVERFGAWPR